MAFLYAPFIYLLPFFLLICLFLFGSFLLFHGCVLLATLCPISIFAPRTNHLSDATSSVKLYLSHAAVHFDEIWSRKFKRTHISTSEARLQREWTPPTPLVSRFSIPHFTAFSKSKRTFFSETLFEIHLHTLKCLLLFNHTLLKDF